jgi:hypothetical protein
MSVSVCFLWHQPSPIPQPHAASAEEPQDLDWVSKKNQQNEWNGTQICQWLNSVRLHMKEFLDQNAKDFLISG